MVEQWTENPRVPSSILGLGTIIAGCGNSSAVEHRLAKARVAGSNPVFRSIFVKLNGRHSQVVRQRTANPSSSVRIRVPPPFSFRVFSRRSRLRREGKGAVSSEEECLLDAQEVTGSSPVPPTMGKFLKTE